jgi:kumamolisin
MATKKSSPPALAGSKATEPRTLLPGSEKAAYRFSTGVVRLPAAKRIKVSVLVCRKQPIDAAQLGMKRVSRAQFNARHAADPKAITAVRAFARKFGLTATAYPDRRMVHLEGSVSAMQKAFGVALTQHRCADGKTYRIREGGIHLPSSLEGKVEAVLGLDDRPQAVPHFRVARPRAVTSSYTPVQVGQLYSFPAGASAKGQTIGIIELGGGYRAADITAYFKSLGVAAPSVTAISVDGGKNSPTTSDGADGEVMLDIEMAAAVAVGAKVAVYFAPNTDQGFLDALSTAIHDTKNKPSVISISWGGPESSWTAQAMQAMDSAAQAAAALGISITAASGDNGSDDGVGDGANHVDFPASSPHVLACGGTTLKGSGSGISSEVVWNETASQQGATGGGISTVFAQPAWQKSVAATAKGRGVPDVAGDADPTTGYQVRVDGKDLVIGGTSAVAPLWAGLIALANAQNKTPAGFLQPALYANPAAFRDVTSGNNGAFKAGKGWDACTGLGSPIGTAIVKALAPAKK